MNAVQPKQEDVTVTEEEISKCLAFNKATNFSDKGADDHIMDVEDTQSKLKRRKLSLVIKPTSKRNCSKINGREFMKDTSKASRVLQVENIIEIDEDDVIDNFILNFAENITC